MGKYVSWGTYSPHRPTLHDYYWDNELARLMKSGAPVLAVGNRRSYGDVCLNTHGLNIVTDHADRFIQFDRDNGIVECCAGVGLDELNAITVAAGWFVPVTPGTKYVTLGGMVANDVHGKNHHNAGTFGNHVLELTVLRSNDGFVVCRPDVNSDLFAATIGGMGLTGVITRIKIKLKKIASRQLFVEDIPYSTLHEFHQLTEESDAQWEYTVSWLNGGSVHADDATGVFSRAKHVDKNADYLIKATRSPLHIPFVAPNLLLNRPLLKLFNRLYAFIHRRPRDSITEYNSFFYPLDQIENWNILYGKRGFFQYQFVVPMMGGLEVIKEILAIAKNYSHEPYLSVLKTFGTIKSVGLMSFPQAGYTLAMDFPHRGKATLTMLEEFDRILLAHHGKLYPAKDARMSADTFQRMYPQAEKFKEYIDPGISSDFWRRVYA
jgi:FAD/FMN-containing dehydrogenase